METTNEQFAATGLDAKSRFTGGMMANFFINFVTMILSAVTLGLAYPFMVCWKLKWQAKHTYLNGKQLTFDGNGMQLFGNYIKWLLLSIITLGLYFILSASVKLAQWQTKHTHFADGSDIATSDESIFSGKWYQLFAVNFISGLITVITLSFGYYWAHCYRERWFCKHKTIDGRELYFDGTGAEYFGKRIVWMLLTIVTFGIYSFWLQIKSVKWTVSHTKIK